jgi:hypothetical protein
VRWWSKAGVVACGGGGDRSSRGVMAVRLRVAGSGRVMADGTSRRRPGGARGGGVRERREGAARSGAWRTGQEGTTLAKEEEGRGKRKEREEKKTR